MSCCLSIPEGGFLEEVTYGSIVLGPGYDRPFQFDPGVREPKSIQLYRHLNLKSCLWTFDAYYDMTELIDVCGGSVTADFQVRCWLLNTRTHWKYKIVPLVFHSLTIFTTVLASIKERRAETCRFTLLRAGRPQEFLSNFLILANS